MDISKRLEFIANHIDKCESIIDVGTDHGYIPIYAVKKGLCNKAIASDINKDPVKKAQLNVAIEGLSKKIDVRLGGGLQTVDIKEVEGVVIAGMGGNLIRDILEHDKKKLPFYKFLILQPAQNPEVLREYLYNNGYEVLEDKHPLMIGYLKEKEEKYNRIVSFIKEDSESAIRRKKEVQDKLNEIKRFIEEVK